MDIDSENEAGGGGAVPRSSNDQSVAICDGTHAGDENVPPGAAPETPPQRPKKRVPLQLNTKVQTHCIIALLFFSLWLEVCEYIARLYLQPCDA